MMVNEASPKHQILLISIYVTRGGHRSMYTIS